MSDERVKLYIKPISSDVIMEDTGFLQLCKPRLIPLKSFTLEKLEKLQKEALEKFEEENNEQE